MSQCHSVTFYPREYIILTQVMSQKTTVHVRLPIHRYMCGVRPEERGRESTWNYDTYILVNMSAIVIQTKRSIYS